MILIEWLIQRRARLISHYTVGSTGLPQRICDHFFVYLDAISLVFHMFDGLEGPVLYRDDLHFAVRLYSNDFVFVGI